MRGSDLGRRIGEEVARGREVGGGSFGRGGFDWEVRGATAKRWEAG